jgi:hypothetical protein
MIAILRITPFLYYGANAGLPFLITQKAGAARKLPLPRLLGYLTGRTAVFSHATDVWQDVLRSRNFAQRHG